MALIEHGSLNQFSALVHRDHRTAVPAFEGLDQLRLIRQAARQEQPMRLELPVSDSPRGLGLKSLTLRRGFEGFMQRVFNDDNEVFFVAWTWDLSGQPPVQYPSVGAKPDDLVIPMTVGETREFIGRGVLLFPSRPVTAGLAVRIQLWESDKGARNFGKTLQDVSQAISESELNNLLQLVGTAAGATTATAVLIEKAALELAHVTGTILKANSDDYVDFFEGYYPASDVWRSGEESYDGHSSAIVLDRFT